MITLLFARLVICGTVMSFTADPIITDETEYVDNMIEESYVEPNDCLDTNDCLECTETITSGLPKMIGESGTMMISDKEIGAMYEKFIISKKGVVSLDDYYSPILVEEFVDHAVSEGYIEDTPVQRALFSKLFLRSCFFTVAGAGRLAGYTTSATLLEHSLQDNPSDLSYSSNTSYANQIKYSSECNSIVNAVRNYVRGKSITYYSVSSHISLTSSTDLHLAYHNVDYTVTAQKSGHTWNLTIVFLDTYDFEYQSWANSMTDNQAVTIINNYAAYAQSQGAIVPYNISVTVSTSFTQ